MGIIQITATSTPEEYAIFGMNRSQEICIWNYLTSNWDVYSKEAATDKAMELNNKT